MAISIQISSIVELPNAVVETTLQKSMIPSRRLCTWPSQVIDIITKFYQDPFTTGGPCSFEEVIDTIPRVVSPEMNATLSADFTINEVEVAIRQMAPLKAPSPDGMPPLFYQNYWSLIGSDVSSTILHYLNTGVLPLSLGHSFITLIPKVKNPKFVLEFHPISLCNVLYKFFSKVLTNHLKVVMPQIIYEHQNAFISNHLILYNILVAFETLHYLRNHNSGATGYMALKLDMSKAYDSVE